MPEKKRILTGVRPTGLLHLGHYAGALDNWLELQGDYDCYFLIADYQVPDYADDLSRVRKAAWEVALDWLAVGLDPESASFVIESGVPEHAELTTWLACFLPIGVLERNPTLKAEREAIKHLDDATTIGRSLPVAFYIYPVMQVENILLSRALQALGRALKRAHITQFITTTQHGQPMTYSGAGSAWKRAVKRANVQAAHFHYLKAKVLTDVD